MRVLVVLPSLMLVAISGCVARAERRDTNTEAAAGAPSPPRDEHTAGEIVAGSPKPPPSAQPTAAPGPDWVWVKGAWRWTGVRYEWAPPHWEKRSAAYARPY